MPSPAKASLTRLSTLVALPPSRTRSRAISTARTSHRLRHVGGNIPCTYAASSASALVGVMSCDEKSKDPSASPTIIHTEILTTRLTHESA